MLSEMPTLETIETWKNIWIEYKDKLKPNRKSGIEILQYLEETYPLKKLEDTYANEVVTRSVLDNKIYKRKLKIGVEPNPVTFIIKNRGNGKKLYDNQDKLYKGYDIFVGIDIESGFFCVEGSSMLWDELYTFRGLDEMDIKNFYFVSEYIYCLKKFGLLEQVLNNEI